MTTWDDDFNPRPGRIGHGNRGAKRPKTFVGEVIRAAKKAGHRGQTFRRSSGTVGRSTFGRGRRAALSLASRSRSRRVVVMARVARHRGGRSRSAPLSKHIAYLRREGVFRDGADPQMFDATSDDADTKAFIQRCEADRHHFRFTVSPEDANQMADLRAFTRELMKDAEHDLATALDWVAVDHWNTDNPHIHVLVRGRADDGQDLVISRGYISQGFLAEQVGPAQWTLKPGLEPALRDLGIRGDTPMLAAIAFSACSRSGSSLPRIVPVSRIAAKSMVMLCIYAPHDCGRAPTPSRIEPCLRVSCRRATASEFAGRLALPPTNSNAAAIMSAIYGNEHICRGSAT